MSNQVEADPLGPVHGMVVLAKQPQTLWFPWRAYFSNAGGGLMLPLLRNT